jgi:hypothetical protein
MSSRGRFSFLSEFALTTTLLLFSNSSSGLTGNHKEGDVLNRAIISPADITKIDLGETERKKEARTNDAASFQFRSAVQKHQYKAFAG